MNTLQEKYEFLEQYGTSSFTGMDATCECCGEDVETGYIEQNGSTFICDDCYGILCDIKFGVSLEELEE